MDIPFFFFLFIEEITKYQTLMIEDELKFK